MNTISAEEYKKKYGVEGYKQLKSTNDASQPKSFTQNVSDFSTGVTKGALGTAVGTARAFETLGKGTIAALDPTRTYRQVADQTGLSSLKGDQAKFIDETLTASNKVEKAGKVTEFLAELLYPVGKTSEFAPLLDKGKKFVGASFDNMGSKLSSIPEHAVENGIKIKDKIGDILVNMDQKTKTALDRTPIGKFQEVVDQGKKAFSDDRIITPLEHVGNNIITAIKSLKTKAQQVGAQKSSYLKIPDAFQGNGIKNFNESFNSFMNSKTFIENDKPVVQKMYQEFKKLGSTPSKGQVDKYIDYAQDILYAGEKNLTLPTSSETVSRLKPIISVLNNALKKQLPDGYGKLNQEYGKLAELTSEINTRLGKEGSSAGSFVKRLFSPSDARTKALFDELEKLTGQDFTRDARLAKFVMESLGDTRAISMLEQIPTSVKGVAGKTIDYAIKKVSDPIKAAERYIKKP